MPKYIIEHLEEEITLWSLAEYERISQIVGKNNLVFTNIKNGKEILQELGEVKKESILELNFNNCCLLHPQAEKVLNKKDKFEYYVFGGILGDNPPRKRTQKLNNLNCEKRNLGEKQMSTDTAVEVVKSIIQGKELSEINFIDDPEIKTGENESVMLPYRYISENRRPKMSKKIKELIKTEF